MIEVILLERIERLGTMGQVVKVRPGFARNFLLPQNKALRATKANVDLFEKQRAQLESKNAAERAKAETLSTKIEGLKLVVIRQASEAGQLYGSVAARDVSDAAKEAGHEIPKAAIQIDTPIKVLGLFQVKVKLHPEVNIKVTVNVARSPEEAAMQAEKNAAASKKVEEKAEVVAAFGAPAEEVKEPSEAEDKEAAPKKRSKKEAKAAPEAEAEEETKAAPKAKKSKTKKAAEE